ncbi:MAG: hypothetical protein J6Y37_13940 [Paludibacteraceae bacterium]|nr:hypothetical protein [Paludibacteraceae bacterium]
MKITDGQDRAILLALDGYNREKSNVTAESGTEIMINGRLSYVGVFHAHIYRKGNYRFECEREVWGDGTEHYCVEHKKEGK